MLLIDKLYRGGGKFENSYRAKKGIPFGKLRKKYGVDFDTLKKTNTQLSNPDLIMPGMKIKSTIKQCTRKTACWSRFSTSKTIRKRSATKRICSNANAAWNRRRGRSYVSISTNYTRACHATNTKRSASKTTEGNASETTEGNASETTKRSTGKTTEGNTSEAAKEIQVKPQKEVQKEQPIQKEKPVEKPSVIQKPPVIEKQKPAEKENTKFSVNVLPQPPQPPIKTKKEYKISDVIKKGSELIAPQINKMKPNNIISPQTKKDNIVSPQVKKENVGNIVSPQVKKENVGNIVSPQVKKENVGNIVSPQVKKENVGNIVSPQVKKENIGNIVSPQVKKEM